MKELVAPLISYNTVKWLEPGAVIMMKDLIVAARYCFCFISRTIMPLKKKFVLRHSKIAYLGFLIKGAMLNLG